MISPARRVLIEHYTHGVTAARLAYRADRTYAQRLCVRCERRKRDGTARLCAGCRAEKSRAKKGKQ